MRLPYIKNNGAKDIHENPGKTSPFTKAAAVFLLLGVLWPKALGPFSALFFVVGFVLLFLGRNGNDDPADRLK